MTKLERIEQLAKAATPGPWLYSNHDEGRSRIDWNTQGVNPLFVEGYNPTVGDWSHGDFTAQDWQYISRVDPQTVLALVAVVKAAKGVAESPNADVGDIEFEDLQALYLALEALDG